MNTEPHKENILALCDVIRETSYAIYTYLRSGHREQIYENALAHRLGKLGIIVEQQHDLRVYDEDGTLLGNLRADLLIENKLICEIKGVRAGRRARGTTFRLSACLAHRAWFANQFRRTTA